MLKSGVHRFGRWYIRQVNASAWRSQKPKRINERTVEYRFLLDCLHEISPRTILDVGTGRAALPSLLKTCGYQVTAIDNITDYWPRGMLNQHFHVLDDDILKPALSNQFDVVVCISVLEHIVEFETAVANMLALTRAGGHVIITCPYNERLGSKNVYLEEGSYGRDNPYPCRQYTRQDIERCLDGFDVSLVRQEFWQFFDSPYWSCGNQIIPPRAASPDEPHQHTCLLIRKGR